MWDQGVGVTAWEMFVTMKSSLYLFYLFMTHRFWNSIFLGKVWKLRIEFHVSDAVAHNSSARKCYPPNLSFMTCHTHIYKRDSVVEWQVTLREKRKRRFVYILEFLLRYFRFDFSRTETNYRRETSAVKRVDGLTQPHRAFIYSRKKTVWSAFSMLHRLKIRIRFFTVYHH